MTSPVFGALSRNDVESLGRKRRVLRVLGDGYTVKLTTVSANRQLGPIPASMTDMGSCPWSCPFRDRGCMSEHGPIAVHWRRVAGEGVPWSVFCAQIAALPEGALWCHNEAGDLPGTKDALDVEALDELVRANEGRRGFTYTHRPLRILAEQEAVRSANDRGFTINLSADNVAEADELAALNIGPVVVTLAHNEPVSDTTPAGRPIVICPAVLCEVDGREPMTCARCQLCENAWRKCIVAFPTHGAAKNVAAAAAKGTCGDGGMHHVPIDGPEVEQ